MSEDSAVSHSHDDHGDHGHGHDNHDHGSYRSYIIGFILAAILTIIPFAVVMDGSMSTGWTVAIIVITAVAQVLVHMIWFLHLNSSAEEGWTLLSTLFTAIILIIVLAGSLWVMFHLNDNMMPEMDHSVPAQTQQ